MEKVGYIKFVKLKFGKDKSYFALLILFELFYIATTIYFSVLEQLRDALLAAAFLLVPPAMLALEKSLHLEIKVPFAIGALFLIMGTTIGSGYDLYTISPLWDDILHLYSGFVFGCIGFALCEVFMGEPKNRRSFAMALFFGFCFCLMVALVWELFEYLATELVGADMQEDKLINGFNSYFLSGTHVQAQEVDGIVKTVIYLANGQTITLDGYLDIGLYDTLNDMLICLIGTIAYLIIVPVMYFKSKRLFAAFVPQPVAYLGKTQEEYIRVATDDDACESHAA